MEGGVVRDDALRRAVGMIAFIALIAGGAGAVAAFEGDSRRASPLERAADDRDVTLRPSEIPDRSIVVPSLPEGYPPDAFGTRPSQPIIPPEVLVPGFDLPSGTRPDCPEGRPTTRIITFRVERIDDPYEPDTYEVRIEGEIVNETSEPIFVRQVWVTIDSEPAHNTAAFPDDGGLDPGQRSAWRVDARLQSEKPPAAARTELTWQWSNFDQFACPTV